MTGGAPVALILHPIKVDDPDELVAEVTRRCADAGLPEPLVYRTSPEDAGTGVTRQALDAGAGLVLAAGGDGTVRAVAEALAGSDVPLGIVPQGTGNLLGRNLGLPTEPDVALDVAFAGEGRRVDLGKLSTGEVFAVMAGMGLDAAMVRDAPEGLKQRVGWPAYIVGVVRGLFDRRQTYRIEVDGGPALRRSARTVLIGNVGRLQGGIDLMPEAEPNSGLLEVAILAARGPVEWSAVLARAVTRNHPSRHDERLERIEGRRIVVRAKSPQPREVDGELLDDAPVLEAEVLPGAITVRVPPAQADDSADTSTTRRLDAALRTEETA